MTLVGTNENADDAPIRERGATVDAALSSTTHLTTLTTHVHVHLPLRAAHTFIGSTTFYYLEMNRVQSSFLYECLFFVAVPSRRLLLIFFAVGQVHAIDVRVKAVLQNMVNLLHVKLQSSRRPKKWRRRLPQTLLTPATNSKRQKLLKVCCLVLSVELQLGLD